MAIYVYEFDVRQKGDSYTAGAFDLDCTGTGKTAAEAAAMAAMRLRGEIERRLSRGEERAIPVASSGNAPSKEGGILLLVALDVSFDSIDTMTATEAAEALGVTRARVSQLVKSGLLDGKRKGRATFITAESVRRRIESRPHPGRPAKATPS